MNSIVFRYPFILGKSEEQIEAYFSTLSKHNIDEATALEHLLIVPRLVSLDLDARMDEFYFIFELYNKMKREDVQEIMAAFPYGLTATPRKIRNFCGQFKKYRLTPRQIKHFCIKSGGLLGSSVSNFKGVYDTLR